jgi:FkbH-like protein
VIPAAEAMAIERRVRRVETIAAGSPGASVSVAGRRGIPSRLAGRWKQRVSARPDNRGLLPNAFLIEVFNPASTVVRISLRVSNPDTPPFEALLELQPGFQAVEVPLDSMQSTVDLHDDLLVALDPNVTRPDQEGLTLYFGLVAFVVREASPADPIKVAVWDLDQTLWSGTLLEDGLGGIRLRDEVVTVVRELDRRGIVNSVLSRNHPDDGLAALRHFGVEELFVFPKIGWDDKGDMMKELVADFDLDVTTFAFIDDQAFERARVLSANPAIRVYDSRDARSLLDLAEFRPPASAESASRRTYYRAEERRGQAHAAADGDALDFLRTCDLRIDITHPGDDSMDRIHELVQRTNQLNYTGIHYTREQAETLIHDQRHEAFVVSCVDAFGDYGTIGFLLVNTDGLLVTDAMFSCRIHFKHVEHAVLTFLLQLMRSRGADHVDVRFRETRRNAAAASVFDDLGFSLESSRGADRLYRFDLGREIIDEGIVAVGYEGTPWLP